MAGCAFAYFEPLKWMVIIILLLFSIDFLTGYGKNVYLRHQWCLCSKKLRWSFVKMFVYIFLMLLIFLIAEKMGISTEMSVYAVKVAMWMVIYVEGLSIVENLGEIWPDDRVLKFLHFLLSVEFVDRIPLLYNFLKEKEDGKS
jgi:hypothetical protein